MFCLWQDGTGFQHTRHKKLSQDLHLFHTPYPYLLIRATRVIGKELTQSPLKHKRIVTSFTLKGLLLSMFRCHMHSKTWICRKCLFTFHIFHYMQLRVKLRLMFSLRFNEFCRSYSFLIVPIYWQLCQLHSGRWFSFLRLHNFCLHFILEIWIKHFTILMIKGHQVLTSYRLIDKNATN